MSQRKMKQLIKRLEKVQPICVIKQDIWSKKHQVNSGYSIFWGFTTGSCDSFYDKDLSKIEEKVNEIIKEGQNV